MGWANSLLWTGVAFGLACVALIWACDFFSIDKIRAREMRRLRKRRVKAMRFLRSTAERTTYNHYEGARDA